MRRTVFSVLAALTVTAAPAAAQTYTFSGCSSFGSCHWFTLTYLRDEPPAFPGGTPTRNNWWFEARHVFPELTGPYVGYAFGPFGHSVGGSMAPHNWFEVANHGDIGGYRQGPYLPGEYWDWPMEIRGVVGDIPISGGVQVGRCVDIRGCQYSTEFTVHLTPVPEPATVALLGGGLLALGGVGVVRRRQR